MQQLNLNNKMTYELKNNFYNRNITVLDAWIKFLSYVKPEEFDSISKLKSNDKTNLTSIDLENVSKITRQLKMAKEFTLYKEKKCNKQQYDEVCKYMEKSIEDLMLDRMDFPHKRYAYDRIVELKSKSYNEVEAYISNESRNYKNLSIADAYVLHEMVKYNFVRKNANIKNSKLSFRK